MAVPTLNPDGVSIKGCSYIYAPKGQAGEYAALACNPYRGCGHACAYCYVPLVTKQNRAEFNKGAVERKRFLFNLERDARMYRDVGSREQVMMSFTTDPYHPGEHHLTRYVIERLKANGLGVCTLTKGGTLALADLPAFRPRRDAFASTMTSLDEEFSRKWEPRAAPPRSRVEALKAFREAGIFTWVSLEPTLDVESSLGIVSATHAFVDLYKVGKANYLPSVTKKIDWRDYTLRMIALCHTLGAAVYIKQDLQEYLPAGYVNQPRRVPQHH